MILEIYDKVGDFLDGETVEGETSGATGTAITASRLLCCGEVNPIDLISPYFSAIFLPPPDQRLALEDIVGTFEDDEKIIGQTSGAYAYIGAKLPVFIYHYAATAPFIKKYGEYRNNWALAWDDYDNDLKWGGGPTSGSAGLHWGAWQIADGMYYNEVGGKQLALRFYTSDVDPSPLTITLRLDIDTIIEDLGTPTLKLYKLTEPVDPETHWNYEANHIADVEISAVGTYDIELTEDDVNIGGITRILVRLASTDASQPTPPDPDTTEYNAISFSYTLKDNTWLKFTY